MSHKLSEHARVIVRKLALVLLCCAAVFLAGCFESKQDYTINPDGSGKVTLDVLFDPSAVSMGSSQNNPQKEMEAAVRKIIKDAKGVDVWKDVTYKRMPDGRVNFKGTAYFPDLSKVDIQNYGTSFSLAKEGTTVTLLMKEEKEGKQGAAKKPAAPSTPPTEAEVDAEIQKAKGEWERSKPMMAAMLSGLKKEATLRLPGKMIEVNNFTKLGPGCPK